MIETHLHWMAYPGDRYWRLHQARVKTAPKHLEGCHKISYEYLALRHLVKGGWKWTMEVIGPHGSTHEKGFIPEEVDPRPLCEERFRVYLAARALVGGGPLLMPRTLVFEKPCELCPPSVVARINKHHDKLMNQHIIADYTDTLGELMAFNDNLCGKRGRDIFLGLQRKIYKRWGKVPA